MGQLVRLLRLQLPAHHFHGDRKSLRDSAAQVTQLQTRYGMTGTVQTQERGGAGGAQAPLNFLTKLNAALHCKDQAAILEVVEQEQWGAEGVQPPLIRSHYIRYNFNAGCSAGSAPFL